MAPINAGCIDESTAISVTGANPETGAEEKHTSVEMASVDEEKYF
jgi:hypothetical protein